MPHASYWAFFLHLTHSVCMLDDRTRHALMSDTELGNFISYNDPTGEAAVRNVLAVQQALVRQVMSTTQPEGINT